MNATFAGYHKFKMAKNANDIMELENTTVGGRGVRHTMLAPCSTAFHSIQINQQDRRFARLGLIHSVS